MSAYAVLKSCEDLCQTPPTGSNGSTYMVLEDLDRSLPLLVLPFPRLQVQRRFLTFKSRAYAAADQPVV